MSHTAIELTNVSKVYRRYARRRQFATLKSALLSRSLVSDLTADETFPAVRDMTVAVQSGKTLGRHRTKRFRQEHAAEARRRHHQADHRHRQGQRPDLRADRARRRVSSRDLRPRERLHQRHHARSDEARDRPAIRRDRRVRGARGLHRRAGQDLLLRDVHASRFRRRDSRRPRRSSRRRSARRRRRGLHPQVPRQVRRLQTPRQDHPARDPLPRTGRTLLR